MKEGESPPCLLVEVGEDIKDDISKDATDNWIHCFSQVAAIVREK